MNIQQTGELLARIQVIDNRRVEESTILAWFELVEDVDYALAVEAVRLHFRESTAYLVPAHVRAGVDRIMAAGHPRPDEFGNDPVPDLAAVAAWHRVQQQKGIEQ